MDVDECKRRTSYNRFRDWTVYWEIEANAFNADRYYWAQIAAEIRRGHAKKPASVKTEQLLIKFQPKVDPIKRVKPTQAEIDVQKSAWANVCGIKLKPKNKGNDNG